MTDDHFTSPLAKSEPDTRPRHLRYGEQRLAAPEPWRLIIDPRPGRTRFQKASDPARTEALAYDKAIEIAEAFPEYAHLVVVTQGAPVQPTPPTQPPARKPAQTPATPAEDLTMNQTTKQETTTQETTTTEQLGTSLTVQEIVDEWPHMGRHRQKIYSAGHSGALNHTKVDGAWRYHRDATLEAFVEELRPEPETPQVSEKTPQVAVQHSTDSVIGGDGQASEPKDVCAQTPAPVKEVETDQEIKLDQEIALDEDVAAEDAGDEDAGDEEPRWTTRVVDAEEARRGRDWSPVEDLEDSGQPAADERILEILHPDYAQTADQIAREAGLELEACTRLLEDLVRAGSVVRHQGDDHDDLYMLNDRPQAESDDRMTVHVSPAPRPYRFEGSAADERESEEMQLARAIVEGVSGTGRELDVITIENPAPALREAWVQYSAARVDRNAVEIDRARRALERELEACLGIIEEHLAIVARLQSTMSWIENIRQAYERPRRRSLLSRILD